MKKIIMLVCTLCLTLPIFADAQDDLANYVIDETIAMDADTTLTRAAQLVLASKFLFNDTGKDLFYEQLAPRFATEGRTEKEKAALYQLMEFEDPEKEYIVRNVLFEGADVVTLTQQDEELNEIDTIATAFLHAVRAVSPHEDRNVIARIIFYFMEEHK